MSYFDRELLLDGFVNKEVSSIRKALSSVDKAQIEKDIAQASGDVFKPFLCTDKPIHKPEQQLEAQDQDLLEPLYHAVQGSKPEARRGLKLLKKMLKKYPDNPMIYNFISSAYETLGQDKKYSYVVKKTCKKFPDYLFGKISLANYYIMQGQHEKVPEVFEHKLQLYMHHAETNNVPTFHQSEIQSFYTVMGRYYAKSQQIAYALKCYFLVEEAGICDHLKVLGGEILMAEFLILMQAGMGNLLTHEGLSDE